MVWVLPKRHDKALLAVLNQFLEIAVQNKLPEKNCSTPSAVAGSTENLGCAQCSQKNR